MTPEMIAMKMLFEQWIQAQFTNLDVNLLQHFSVDDGYEDETVNAMWIGFCAGIELQPFINVKGTH